MRVVLPVSFFWNLHSKLPLCLERTLFQSTPKCQKILWNNLKKTDYACITFWRLPIRSTRDKHLRFIVRALSVPSALHGLETDKAYSEQTKCSRNGQDASNPPKRSTFWLRRKNSGGVANQHTPKKYPLMRFNGVIPVHRSYIMLLNPSRVKKCKAGCTTLFFFCFYVHCYVHNDRAFIGRG